MKQLGTSMHKDMPAYQMDFGFGGFVGYGGGVSAGLVKEEKKSKLLLTSGLDFFFFVGITGLEPATSRPPDVCATNCAKSRLEVVFLKMRCKVMLFL